MRVRPRHIQLLEGERCSRAHVLELKSFGILPPSLSEILRRPRGISPEVVFWSFETFVKDAVDGKAPSPRDARKAVEALRRLIPLGYADDRVEAEIKRLGSAVGENPP